MEGAFHASPSRPSLLTPAMSGVVVKERKMSGLGVEATFPEVICDQAFYTECAKFTVNFTSSF